MRVVVCARGIECIKLASVTLTTLTGCVPGEWPGQHVPHASAGCMLCQKLSGGCRDGSYSCPGVFAGSAGRRCLNSSSRLSQSTPQHVWVLAGAGVQFWWAGFCVLHLLIAIARCGGKGGWAAQGGVILRTALNHWWWWLCAGVGLQTACSACMVLNSLQLGQAHCLVVWVAALRGCGFLSLARSRMTPSLCPRCVKHNCGASLHSGTSCGCAAHSCPQASRGK